MSIIHVNSVILVRLHRFYVKKTRMKVRRSIKILSDCQTVDTVASIGLGLNVVRTQVNGAGMLERKQS